MRVTGFDLSLTATGVARADGVTDVLTCAERGTQRLVTIRHKVLHTISLDNPDLVVFEDLVLNGPRGSGALGPLHGAVRCGLHDAGIRSVLFIPPATLKKYATGRGNASKNEVLVSAVRRLGYTGCDDNEADALWLRAIGLDLCGAAVVVVPAAHRVALEKVHLPEVDLSERRTAS